MAENRNNDICLDFIKKKLNEKFNKTHYIYYSEKYGYIEIIKKDMDLFEEEIRNILNEKKETKITYNNKEYVWNIDRITDKEFNKDEELVYTNYKELKNNNNKESIIYYILKHKFSESSYMYYIYCYYLLDIEDYIYIYDFSFLDNFFIYNKNTYIINKEENIENKNIKLNKEYKEKIKKDSIDFLCNVLK